MSDKVLDAYIRQYIQSQKTQTITFAWQGGEPTLMGIEFFQKAITLQNKYAHPGIKIENTLQTNGTLLDDNWGKFFKNNDFLIGISIDGTQDLHNHYRKNKGGENTFDQVIKGLNILKKFEVEYNILCTVHAANAHYPLEIYRFFRDELQSQYFQFIPIVERDNKTGFQTGNKTTDRSVTAKHYGAFLNNIFDEWVKNDVSEIFVQIFDVALGSWLGVSGGLCIFEKTCGLGVALEHNGDLYSCDHYVEPKHKLGNIINTDMIDLMHSQKQAKFGLAKLDSLTQKCVTCNVRFACNGGCPKNRITHSGDGEYGLNYLCDGYYSFFNHIDEPMKKMASLIKQNKSAAEIMVI